MKKIDPVMQKKCTDFICGVLPLLELGSHELEILYRKNSKKTEDREVFADILLDARYRRITINIYPKLFTEPKEVQVQALLHELSHTITWGQKENAYALNRGELITEDAITHTDEIATSFISQILYRVAYCQEGYVLKELIQEYLNEDVTK